MSGKYDIEETILWRNMSMIRYTKQKSPVDKAEQQQQHIRS